MATSSPAASGYSCSPASPRPPRVSAPGTLWAGADLARAFLALESGDERPLEAASASPICAWRPLRAVAAHTRCSIGLHPPQPRRRGRTHPPIIRSAGNAANLRSGAALARIRDHVRGNAQQLIGKHRARQSAPERLPRRGHTVSTRARPAAHCSPRKTSTRYSSQKGVRRSLRNEAPTHR